MTAETLFDTEPPAGARVQDRHGDTWLHCDEGWRLVLADRLSLKALPWSYVQTWQPLTHLSAA